MTDDIIEGPDYKSCESYIRDKIAPTVAIVEELFTEAEKEHFRKLMSQFIHDQVTEEYYLRMLEHPIASRADFDLDGHRVLAGDVEMLIMLQIDEGGINGRRAQGTYSTDARSEELEGASQIFSEINSEVVVATSEYLKEYPTRIKTFVGDVVERRSEDLEFEGPSWVRG